MGVGGTCGAAFATSESALLGSAAYIAAATPTPMSTAMSAYEISQPVRAAMLKISACVIKYCGAITELVRRGHEAQLLGAARAFDPPCVDRDVLRRGRESHDDANAPNTSEAVLGPDRRHRHEAGNDSNLREHDPAATLAEPAEHGQLDAVEQRAPRRTSSEYASPTHEMKPIAESSVPSSRSHAPSVLPVNRNGRPAEKPSASIASTRGSRNEATTSRQPCCARGFSAVEAASAAT